MDVLALSSSYLYVLVVGHLDINVMENVLLAIGKLFVFCPTQSSPA